MQWTLVTSLTAVFVIMYIAELVTKKTKARVPSLLIVSIFFLAGYWSGFFPKDILDISFVNQIRQIMLLFVLINIGTMFDINEIKREWRTVVVILAAVAGIVVIVTPVGGMIFGREMAMAAVPPLTGGGMASLLMSDQAAAMGLPEVAMLATIVYFINLFTGQYFSSTILEIAIGIIGVMLGFLEKEPLKKAESNGLLQICLTASFMRNFANSTPEQVFGLIVPIIGFLILGSIAITVFSVISGKLMKFSFNMSMAIGLNCFLGFPFNYIICSEAISAVAETEEREYLNTILMPKMIISGIVAVSIVSTIIAGVFIGMM